MKPEQLLTSRIFQSPELLDGVLPLPFESKEMEYVIPLDNPKLKKAFHRSTLRRCDLTGFTYNIPTFIEVQLNSSDDTHMNQLVQLIPLVTEKTFFVWIASNFDPEHIDAISKELENSNIEMYFITVSTEIIEAVRNMSKFTHPLNAMKIIETLDVTSNDFECVFIARGRKTSPFISQQFAKLYPYLKIMREKSNYIPFRTYIPPHKTIKISLGQDMCFMRLNHDLDNIKATFNIPKHKWEKVCQFLTVSKHHLVMSLLEIDSTDNKLSISFSVSDPTYRQKEFIVLNILEMHQIIFDLIT